MEEKKKKKFQMPHTYIILVIFALIMAVCTYVVPAGEFVRVEDPNTGRTVIDPESFHYVENNPVTPFEFIKAYPTGMNAAASVTLFVFITGGSFAIIMETGSINKAIGRLAASMRGKEKILIPFIMLVFSLGGATFGMWEETLPFIPLAVLLARSVGYDAMVGVGMVLIGANAGFSSGWLNPFTTGIAQSLAGLPMFSGLSYRLVIYVLLLIVGMAYVLRYATKVKNNPELSIVAELEKQEADNKMDLENLEAMTHRDILVLLAFVIGMGTIVFGVIKYGWYLTEIGAIFMTMGAICGLLGGSTPSEVAAQFVEGAKGIAYGALITGVARAAVVIMESGSIIDTVVYALSGVIGNLPPAMAAAGMYIVQIAMDFVITSGSGQAAATMPIMLPLADILGITRQTAVLAFQFGDGFTNAFWPQCGTLMAALAFGGVTYDKWLKFFAPLMGIWFVMCCGFCAYAGMTGWGPF